MKNRVTVLTVIVVLSLLFNLWSFGRINNLQQELTNLQDQTYHQTNHFESRLSQLYHTVNQIEYRNRWVLDVTPIPDQENSTMDELYLTLKFNLREYEQNAKIYLQYNEFESEEWIKVQAETEGNSFLAPLVLSPHKDYQYQILMEGATIKEGEIITLPWHFYKYPEMFILGFGESRNSVGRVEEISVTVGLDGYYEQPIFDIFKISQVSLVIKRKDGTTEYNTVKPGYDEPFIDLAYTITDDIDTIFAELEFIGGHIQRKEIYPEFKYR